MSSVESYRELSAETLGCGTLCMRMRHTLRCLQCFAKFRKTLKREKHVIIAVRESDGQLPKGDRQRVRLSC